MTGDDGIGCMGWCPYPIALARLGLAEELVSELINSVSTYQFYPQGFGHYGPVLCNQAGPGVSMESESGARREQAIAGKTGAHIPFSHLAVPPFRQRNHAHCRLRDQ